MPFVLVSWRDDRVHGKLANPDDAIAFLSHGRRPGSKNFNMPVGKGGMKLLRWMLSASSKLHYPSFPERQGAPFAHFTEPGMLALLYPIVAQPPFAFNGGVPSETYMASEQKDAALEKKITFDPPAWQLIHALKARKAIISGRVDVSPLPVAEMIRNGMRMAYSSDKQKLLNLISTAPKTVKESIIAAAKAAGVWDDGKLTPENWHATFQAGGGMFNVRMEGRTTSLTPGNATSSLEAIEPADTPDGPNVRKRVTMTMKPDGSVDRKVEKTAIPEAEGRVCSGPTCGKRLPAEEALKCGACKRAYYCNSECQRSHWKMGHKSECKSWQAKEALTESMSKAGIPWPAGRG